MPRAPSASCASTTERRARSARRLPAHDRRPARPVTSGAGRQKFAFLLDSVPVAPAQEAHEPLEEYGSDVFISEYGTRRRGRPGRCRTSTNAVARAAVALRLRLHVGGRAARGARVPAAPPAGRRQQAGEASGEAGERAHQEGGGGGDGGVAARRPQPHRVGVVGARRRTLALAPAARLPRVRVGRGDGASPLRRRRRGRVARDDRPERAVRGRARRPRASRRPAARRGPSRSARTPRTTPRRWRPSSARCTSTRATRTARGTTSSTPTAARRPERSRSSRRLAPRVEAAPARTPPSRRANKGKHIEPVAFGSGRPQRPSSASMKGSSSVPALGRHGSLNAVY